MKTKTVITSTPELEYEYTFKNSRIRNCRMCPFGSRDPMSWITQTVNCDRLDRSTRETRRRPSWCPIVEVKK
jgi:hypothetical protein